jgi:hypothetical protein
VIRQLRRLTRSVPAAGPGALALATYAEARDGAYELHAAAEQGFEGVACIDDSARAATLYCAVWRRTGRIWARTTAEGLLRFVAYMQDEQGRFANFILDWDGHRNLTGPSSFLGGGPWTARAMHALASGAATFGAAEYAERFERGLAWLDRSTSYLDVRAGAILAVLEYRAATGATGAAKRALAWAEEIAASRLGDLLPDVPGCPDIHLWGHMQEAALARVGQAFDRMDLVDVARAGVDSLFVPRVARAFEAPTTLPFDVSCAVLGLSAVAEATGQARYAKEADLARKWFRGRNAAHRPMYDRRRGLVYDGIDDGSINPNSGAESNIEGALALFDSLPWYAYSR